MASSGQRTIVGVFEDRAHAEQAINELRRMGFTDQQIGGAGTLTRLGLPEEETRHYDQAVKAGATIVAVEPGSRFEEVRNLFQRFGGREFRTRPTMAQAGTTGSTEEQRTIQAREERLHPHKEEVEKGEVGVRKEVTTEQQTIEVPVTREEVVVERHPVEGREAAPGEIREGEEVRIPVREEEVRVEKTPVVTEEVTVGKREVQEKEKVSGTVRKEDIKVEKEGDVDVRDQNR